MRGLVLPILGAMLLHATPPALAQEEGPPLQISADNVIGSRSAGGDTVFLNGNVRIVRGRTVLTADQGRYLRSEGIVHVEGDVEMVDSTTTVTCDRASYSEPRDLLELGGDVTLEDGDAVLRAPAATYDRRRSRVDLYGGVEGNDGDLTLTADRVVYHRESQVLQARGNVRGIDEKNDLELSATSIDFDRVTHEAVATGDPELRAFDDRGHQTVIRALELRLNTETRVAEAVDSVRVERDTLQARGDYGLFDDAENRGWLLGNPRAWDAQTTVSGDTLEMWTEDRELKRVVVLGSATVDYRGALPTTLGETSRLTGRRVDVFLTSEQIDSLVAVGGARNDYQAVPQAGKTAETNSSEGDTITVFFDNGKVDRARVEGGARGEYQLAVDIGDTLSAEEERVSYDASRIRYVVSENKIILEDSAHMIYRDLELTARRVEFDVDRQTLVARGDPELVDRGDKVKGHVMTYDLESRIGNIYRAETTYEQGLYHGERIRKVNDNELDVMNGRYSTCELETPHYHFSAHWMKIYLKDKLVAKPVVFYVGKVPLLALPFWIFPIKQGRHSGFLFPQFEFGFSNRAGQFIRNAGYYWAPNDYMDLTLSGDYYQFEPSWIVRAESRYKLLYVLDGTVRGSFARNERDSTENWDFNADHSQVISPRTRLVARASFVSSRDFNSDNRFGHSLSRRLNRFLTSSLAISHSADWASFNAVLDRRQDLDADESLKERRRVGQAPDTVGTTASLPNLTQRVPTLSVSFPPRTIGALGFIKGTPFEKPLSSMYFDLNTQFVLQSERRGFVSGYEFIVDTAGSVLDSNTVIGQRVTRRYGLAANTSMSDARRMFGWLNVRPSLTGTAVLFDHDVLGNRLVPTGSWSSALTASTTLYGTFLPRLGSLQGIRHIVTPSASFSYSPEFPHLTYIDDQGRKRNRFDAFGGIGVSGFRRFVMNFGLDQRLQVKWGRGEQVKKLDNLLSWGMRGSYNFLYKEQGLKHPLSLISSSAFVQPPGVLSANLSWITDVYSPRPVRSFGYNVGFNLSSATLGQKKAPELPLDEGDSPFDEDVFEEDWSVDVAYSYSGGYGFPDPRRWSSSQTANVVLRYKLTEGWGLDYSASYDVTNREVGTQRFALSRDLHCWQAVFTRTFAPDGEAEYYFRLGVKNQREIYIERGTRSGSIGGIQ